MCEETQSVVSQEMIDAFAAFFTCEKDVAEGSLKMWEEGKGELDANLVNGNPIFMPVVEAYYKSLGFEVPETVKVPLTPVELGPEKLPDPVVEAE